MTAQTKQEELQFKISYVRDNIIQAANNGYGEAINDMDYYDKPLLELINSEVLSVLEELEGEAVENVNGVKVIGIHHLESIKNRYKQ